ncbi:MAG: carboxypeptidase regulatory-like domain-containing protein [Flavobacteriales bacterium]|nr:carboxypeptidase regulatory-like domain-containing protein [Flavobacteriales bacterium]
MRSFPVPRPLLPLAISVPLLFSGCSKEPGEGGKALIRGTVYAMEYNDNTGQPTGNEFYVPEYRVYIRYGDGDFYDDDTRTGPNGEFELRWLRPGSYTVFTYSECPEDCDSGVELVSRIVEINKKKDEVTVPIFQVQLW